MSYGLLSTSSLWQLKLCRKLPSTGRVICHLCRDPGSFSHWGNVDPVNLRAMTADCFHKFCGEPPKKKHAKLQGRCIIKRRAEEGTPAGMGPRRAVAIPLRWEEHMAACKCGWRRAGCGPDRALSTSSLSKWHRRSATSQLPRGGWQWSPRMNTSLIKANEAFFASSACVEKNNGGRNPPPRPPLRFHTLHTWNV